MIIKIQNCMLNEFLNSKLIVLAGKWMLLGALATVPQISAYGQTPAREKFPQPIADFSRYQEQVFGYLSRRSLPQRTPGQVRLNLPFELSAEPSKPYRGKFLLIHGLNDSPFVWRDVASRLSRKGYDVRAILLPGHGATPIDMLDVSYRQWLTVSRKHLALWQTDDTPFYIGGFSLGGVVATVLALENEEIKGLLLFSPAYRSRLNSYLRWSWLYAKFKPWIFGGMILEDNPTKFNSIPVNSGTQFYRTTRYLKKRWQKRRLTMPVLMVLSEDDSVVDVEYTRNIFNQRFTSYKKQLLLYSARQNAAPKESEVIRNSQALDRRILNQSHMSLLNAPNNPLFGESRRILVCNGNEFPIFMACMRGRKHWYGAQHTPSPDDTPVARTTYNPDFEFVMRSFEQVFESSL
ncbi:MAG: alpha/beta hydrolase [bacterium]